MPPFVSVNERGFRRTALLKKPKYTYGCVDEVDGWRPKNESVTRDA